MLNKKLKKRIIELESENKTLRSLLENSHFHLPENLKEDEYAKLVRNILAWTKSSGAKSGIIPLMVYIENELKQT